MLNVRLSWTRAKVLHPSPALKDSITKSLQVMLNKALHTSMPTVPPTVYIIGFFHIDVDGSAQAILFQAPSISCLHFMTLIQTLGCTEKTGFQNEQRGGFITLSSSINPTARVRWL